MTRYLLLIFCFLTNTVVYAASHSEEFDYWVQITGGNRHVVHAIVPAEQACPILTINGRVTEMHVRRHVDKSAFAVRSCSFILPRRVRRASIAGKPLTLFNKKATRIAIIGDSGCRQKYIIAQRCTNAKKWPFARIAEQIMKHKPDLVIHVGDYHYREYRCPFWRLDCLGKPHGYNWLAWQADFFEPARPLLQSTPWLMLRGNHERCKRAWRGWQYLLAAHDKAEQCIQYSKPYKISLFDWDLWVMDTSNINAKDADLNVYRKQFDYIKKHSKRPAWLITHHPLWLSVISERGKPLELTKQLQTASEGLLSPMLKLALAGHAHGSAVMNFTPQDPISVKRIPQLVVGNSGSKLYANRFVSSNKSADIRISSGFYDSYFGYALAELQDGAWRFTLYDDAGLIRRVCYLTNDGLRCIKG